MPLLIVIARSLGIDPAALLQWQALPPMDLGHWREALALPWGRLISNTLGLTLLAADPRLAAAKAVGHAPALA